MDILHLIDRLEELFNESRPIPLTHNVIVDEDKFLDIIDQMRIAIPEEIKKARFSPARIRALRVKKGLSQKELGALVGVSLGTVVLWEKGKIAPKAERKGALIALRKLRKRELKKILAERKEAAKPRKEKAQPAPARKAARGKKTSLPKKASR